LEISKSFGRILKTLREERQISQERLAELSDLDRTFISMLERGLRQPSLTTLFLLCRALEVSPSEVISKLEKSEPEITPHRDSV
jgi:transcriptional regulator with XRE-family HTH domain